jgi:acyl dehydratase
MIKINKEGISQYVNRQLAPTGWIQITQEQINQFAACTLDHQFIHVNPEQAKSTSFGSTIAHGFLVLSMLSHFAESYSPLIKNMQMGINAGFDKIRFIQPVTVGSRIRAHAKVIEIIEDRTNHFKFKTIVTVEVENIEKPALVAEWNTIQIID